MSFTVEMLNAIRNNASTEYQERIPVATRENITSVGNSIVDYEITFNEFASALIHKIGMTLVNSKLATNRLAKFKRGLLPFGKTIEEIHVEIATAEGTFDPTGANPLGRRLSDIKAMYHSENSRKKYVKSLQDDQLKNAFHSQEGLTKLLAGIVNSIYSGANHDEYIIMKELIAQYKDNYFDYGVTPVTDQASALKMLKTVKKAAQDLTFMTDKFNKAGVMTQNDMSDLVLILHKDVKVHTDVDALATLFNMNKAEFEPNLVIVDDFGSMTDTYGILVDKEWFMVYDTLRKSEQQRNSDGLFTNHFLHIWQVYSTSQFKNAVRFTTNPKAV